MGNGQRTPYTPHTSILSPAHSRIHVSGVEIVEVRVGGEGEGKDYREFIFANPWPHVLAITLHIHC